MLRNDGVRRLGVRAVIAATALACLALVGCRSKTQVHVIHPSTKVVTVEKGHTHYKRCGHYKHKGKWYYSHGHVHKKYCGHKKVKGVWMLK